MGERTLKFGQMDDKDSKSSSVDGKTYRKERISAFDLPVVATQKLIEREASFNRSRRSAYFWDYMKSVMQEARTHESVFRNLNVDVLARVLGKRPNFAYLTDLAPMRVHTDLVKQLLVCYFNSVCSNAPILAEDGIRKHVWGWRLSDFNERRAQSSNLVWIDLMLKESSAVCLEAQKYQSDLNEILYYANLIFDKLVFQKRNEGLQEELNEAAVYLNIEERLIAEMKVNEDEFIRQVSKLVGMNTTRSSVRLEAARRQRKTKEALEHSATFDLIPPIALRHQMAHLNGQVTNYEQRVDVKLGKLESEIKYYQKEVHEMQLSMESTLAIYRLEIQNYKTACSVYAQMYDDRMEKEDLEIGLLQINMQKMYNQRKFLEEQIERFHEEIEAWEQEQSNVEGSVTKQKRKPKHKPEKK